MDCGIAVCSIRTRLRHESRRPDQRRPGNPYLFYEALPPLPAELPEPEQREPDLQEVRREEEVRGLRSTTMAKKPGGPRILRPPGYLSPNEAGLLLGVTGYTIKDHVRLGTIKAVRTANGYHWIKPADLKGLKFGKPTKNPKPRKPVQRRTITFNLKAAKKFGFNVENAMPSTTKR